MDTPLLRTKLYIPAPRPELVARPCLIEQLNAGLHSGRKLTLISAPAGFGKTTLVSEWIDGWSREHRVGSKEQASAFPSTSCRAASGRPQLGSILSHPLFSWLSLDESDNDIARFLTYLIAALQTVETSIGKGGLSALQSPQPPAPETILTSLINGLTVLSTPVVLVFDDYHLIETQAIHDALAFLLEHLPPTMHLVIATREDPPLPMARLRARGQLTELRATELRFTNSEAATFLDQAMGLDLSADDIAALEAHTEGWIAGLQLAAISLQGSSDAHRFTQSFTGSHRYVLDYLIEEVLQQQPESIQEFLLRTSILSRLTGPLCDALTGQEDGQQTLEALERRNLFIVPLDNERRWYRYHHLFSDLLRRRLRQSSLGGEEEQLAKLHILASEWYERNGFADHAIEHALAANHLERAVLLIDKHADAMWSLGEHGKLKRWLAKLPTDWVFSRPHLCILHAWYLFAAGKQDAAEQSLQAAEQALTFSTSHASETSLPDRQDQRAGSYRMNLLGKAAAIRAFMNAYRGDGSGIIEHAQQALAYLPKQDLSMRSIAGIALGDAYAIRGEMTAAYRARLEAAETSKSAGNTYYLVAANLKLATTLRELGRLQRTVSVCQEQWQLAETNGLSQTSLVGFLLAIWGEALTELNDLDEGIVRAERGVELAERGGDLAMLGWSQLCLIRVLFSRGDLAGAERVVQKMGTIAQETDVPPWFTNHMAAWQARLWLAQDELEAASEWAEKHGLDTDGESELAHDLGFLALVELAVFARILIAQKRLDEAIRLLPRLLEVAEAGEHNSRVIELLVLQALAHQAGGDSIRALDALNRALLFAEPGGFVRTFVDEGPPMGRLLYDALSRGIAVDYVQQLLAALSASEKEYTDALEKQSPKTDLIEPLSERELEVLELIAEGLTNPEIASTLFLSRHTIKAHTRNIYGKLGVHNRTLAVTRARALGILSS